MFVQIKNLNFKYKNAKDDTIRDFSLDINKGELISILGQSGSGKSTVLRLLAGLEEPKAGSIIIDNSIVVDDDNFVPPEKRNVGMIFQDYALFPHMSVSDNIKFGLKNMSKKEKEARVLETIKVVDLEGLEKRYPYELSGGQQQRVAIARAIAPEPSILLLDEPFSNLDADLQQKIRSDIHQIIKRIGITSILVTHDKEDANAISDRVVTLESGRIKSIVDLQTNK